MRDTRKKTSNCKRFMPTHTKLNCMHIVLERCTSMDMIVSITEQSEIMEVMIVHIL